MLEDHTLFYAPSLTLLREVTKQPSTGTQLKTLLAFGNPQLSGEASSVRGDDVVTRFGPLPEAEKEVKTLARLYGPALEQIQAWGLLSIQLPVRNTGCSGD